MVLSEAPDHPTGSTIGGERLMRLRRQQHLATVGGTDECRCACYWWADDVAIVADLHIAYVDRDPYPGARQVGLREVLLDDRGSVNGRLDSGERGVDSGTTMGENTS